MANNTARDLAKDLYLKGGFDAYNPIIKDRQAQCSKVVDKFYHSLCDLIIEGMPKEKMIDTYVEFGCEQPHDDYANEKGFNLALSSCKESVRKSLNVPPVP